MDTDPTLFVQPRSIISIASSPNAPSGVSHTRLQSSTSMLAPGSPGLSSTCGSARHSTKLQSKPMSESGWFEWKCKLWLLTVTGHIQLDYGHWLGISWDCLFPEGVGYTWWSIHEAPPPILQSSPKHWLPFNIHRLEYFYYIERLTGWLTSYPTTPPFIFVFTAWLLICSHSWPFLTAGYQRKKCNFPSSFLRSSRF